MFVQKVLLLVLFSCGQVYSLKRTLKVPLYNPNCGVAEVCSTSNESYSNNLVVAEADCSQDKLFYVWSTIGAPSLTLVRTGPSASVEVDWSKMASGEQDVPSVSVNGPVYSTAAYVFSAIWKCQTNDKDAASVNIALDLNDCELVSKIPLDNLNWYNNSHTIAEIGNKDGYRFMFKTDDSTLGGILNIVVTLYAQAGREDDNSGLLSALHSENSTQFQVSLDGFPDSGYARYTLEHTVISPQNNSQFESVSTRGLNDEYTPGVFKYQQLNLKNTALKSFYQPKDMFFGWKVAGFGSSKLDLNSVVPQYLSKDLDQLSVIDVDDRYLENASSSVALNFFVERTYTPSFSLVSFNMTFGTSDTDDGYDGYLAWEGQFGYGDIKYDEVSALIISLTVIGIVTPIIIIIFGGIAVVVLKHKQDLKFEEAAAHEREKERDNIVNVKTDSGHVSDGQQGFNYQHI